MNITILLPHYKTGKMTAYAVHQLLNCKGSHKVKIIVIDNGGGGMEELNRFGKKITHLTYPLDKMQSHGIAFDFALPKVTTDYFITVESDSFPTDPNWLDYYEDLINKGYDCAGSLMTLSGGQYIHPAGAMYRTELWKEASKVEYPYTYFPNVSTKGEQHFAYHLMVHNSFAEGFATDPQFQGIQLHHSYEGLTWEERLAKAKAYEPTRGVFHNGMGMEEEWLATYGKRTIENQVGQIMPEDKGGIIHRVGYEPGQWFCYWLAANGYSLCPIPTEVRWMPHRENQQQEYTLMENSFQHLWGVTAYNGCDAAELKDVVQFKENQMQELWQTLEDQEA